MMINDWQRGRLPYFVPPPDATEADAGGKMGAAHDSAEAAAAQEEDEDDEDDEEEDEEGDDDDDHADDDDDDKPAAVKLGPDREAFNAGEGDSDENERDARSLAETFDHTRAQVSWEDV